MAIQFLESSMLKITSISGLSVNETNGASISFWVNCDGSLTGVGWLFYVFTSVDYFGGYITVSDQAVGEIYDDSTGGTADGTVASVADGQWHNIVVTLDTSGYLRIYVDGTPAGDTQETTNTIDFSPVSVSVGGSYFIGYMADVGFWETTLSDANINALAGGKPVEEVDTGNLAFYSRLYDDLSSSEGTWTVDTGPIQIHRDANPIPYTWEINVAESVQVDDVALYYPDEILLSDSPTVEFANLVISKAESVSVSDTPAVTLSHIATLVTESISVSDSPIAIPTLAISSSEAISVTAAPLLLLLFEITITDTVFVTDTPEMLLEEASLLIPLDASNFVHWVREIKIYE